MSESEKEAERKRERESFLKQIYKLIYKLSINELNQNNTLSTILNKY